MGYPLPHEEQAQLKGPTLWDALHLHGWSVLYFIPVIALSVFLLIVWMQGRERFEADAFSPELLERYAQPGWLAEDLQIALSAGNAALYDDLYGLNRQVAYLVDPDIRSSIVQDGQIGWRSVRNVNATPEEWQEVRDSARFMTYAFSDVRGVYRYTFAFERVNDRWVVTPRDARYLWHSGRWMGAAVPALTIYLMALGIAVLMNYVYLRNQLWRERAVERLGQQLARRSSKA